MKFYAVQALNDISGRSPHGERELKFIHTHTHSSGPSRSPHGERELK